MHAKCLRILTSWKIVFISFPARRPKEIEGSIHGTVLHISTGSVQRLDSSIWEESSEFLNGFCSQVVYDFDFSLTIPLTGTKNFIVPNYWCRRCKYWFKYTKTAFIYIGTIFY